ncbi:hypothetical protein GYA19_04230 [Candidatus Beckwithbacteria bacterium]|nr:hypothetical protein [Candidatus Beckwithbacteria bacterium]
MKNKNQNQQKNAFALTRQKFSLSSKNNFNKKFEIQGKLAAMHNIQRASGRRGN